MICAECTIARHETCYDRVHDTDYASCTCQHLTNEEREWVASVAAEKERARRAAEAPAETA